MALLNAPSRAVVVDGYWCVVILVRLTAHKVDGVDNIQQYPCSGG